MAIGPGRYVGMTGRIIGMHTFGASAPLNAFEPSQVVTAAKEHVGDRRSGSSASIRQDSRSPRGVTSGEEDQSHDYCHFPNSFRHGSFALLTASAALHYETTR